MESFTEKMKYIKIRLIIKKEIDDFHIYMFKLLDMGKIELEDFDRELGKHYKYPKCCVENFIALSKRGIKVASYMNTKYGWDTKNVGYVRCEKCRGK